MARISWWGRQFIFTMNLSGKPCMKNCQAPSKIIGKARDIDVTPEDEKS